MGKQMEGDNRQRRARAAEARSDDRQPSAEGVTTGASGQRRHLANDASHAEKIAGPGWGKQQPDQASPDPRPGSMRQTEPPPAEPPPAQGRAPRRDELTGTDERVFATIVRLEADDEAGTVHDIARASDLPVDETRSVVKRLVRTHDVVQEVPPSPDEPDVGARYRVKSRV